MERGAEETRKPGLGLVSELNLYYLLVALYFLAFGMQFVLFPSLVAFNLDATPAGVGLAQSALSAPMFCLLLFGGLLAERARPSTTIALLYLGFAFTTLILCAVVAAGQLTYSFLITYAVIVGSCAAFAMPVRDAALNGIVAREAELGKHTPIATAAAVTTAVQIGAQIAGILIAQFAGRSPAPYLAIQALALALGAATAAAAAAGHVRAAPTPPTTTATAGAPPIDEADPAALSPERKVAQLLLVAVYAPDSAAPLDEIVPLARELGIGGIVLQTGSNVFVNRRGEPLPAHIAQLTADIQRTALARPDGVPLFIAVDHEGNGAPLTHLREGFTALPSAMSIGATWDPANAAAVGEITGRELAAVGVNVVLGPVLDVLASTHVDNGGDIGTRAFGGHPYWVGRMGSAYVAGVDAGSGVRVLTGAKHFTVHGGTARWP